MQRQQSALVELGLPNDEPVLRDVRALRANASDMRIPVAASRPNSVVYISGLIVPAGGSSEAARRSPAISSDV